MSAASSTAVILDRIQMEVKRIAAARAAIDGMAPGIPSLKRASRAQLLTTLDSTAGDLGRLETRVRRRGVTELLLQKLADLASATDRSVRESFAIAAGALARVNALDGGACQDADLLIVELASLVDTRLARPTVPGDSEALHRAADVIRRRLPDHGLWDLPVMGHEFAHVVVAHLQLYDPGHEQVFVLDDAALGSWPGYTRQQSEELFCDLFATYALGPAYACTQLLHRLDPSASAVTAPSGSHPADASRAAVVLEVQRELTDQEPGISRYRTLTRDLEQVWQALQQAAPMGARCSETQLRDLAKETRRSLTFLQERLPSVRYRWPATEMWELAEVLERGGALPTQRCYRIRDVLNAAWMLHLDAWVDEGAAVPQLEPRARQLIAEIARGQTSDHAT